MNKSSYVLSMLLLVMIGIFLVLMSYQLWYPIQVVTVNEIRLITPEVKPGGELKYYVDATKYIDVPARVVRQLINDTIITLTPSWSHMGKGRSRMVVSMIVPINVHPGRYKLQTSYTYEVNSFRTIVTRWETEYFTVLPVGGTK